MTLLTERGDFLRREQDNWSPKALFVMGKYQAPETWHDRDGPAVSPRHQYYVGGTRL